MLEEVIGSEFEGDPTFDKSLITLSHVFHLIYLIAVVVNVNDMLIAI